MTFTSPQPEDRDWFNRGSVIFQEIVDASASSGLPVTFSIDPASAGVCVISWQHTPPPSRAALYVDGPGTCTIHADQAGDDVYLPAAQATQSFVLHKVQPSLSVLRKTNAAGGRYRTFRATLLGPFHFRSFNWGIWGVEDQIITFLVAGKPVCSGTTDESGIAHCTAKSACLTG